MLHKNEERASDRRLIEETFPIKEVSVEASREKSIRHGHISTLHIWWARRPLASSRTTAYAALVPFLSKRDNKEIERRRRFLIELSKWENSLNSEILQKARCDILDANDGKAPRVLDPFGGGGSIPLEALRLGCETYASDYNPVATFLLKSTLEFPQKYGRTKVENAAGLASGERKNPLLEDIRKWSNWVQEESRKEIGKFYPERDGMIPVGYIWARTIPCQNPVCNAEIPLIRQYWLAKKDGRSISLYPYVHRKEVKFKIVGTGHKEKIPREFDPDNGTISRAISTCPVCGSVIDNKEMASLFRDGKSGQRILAGIMHEQGTNGKHYHIATDADTKAFKDAEKYLDKKREIIKDDLGIDPIPDEPTPDGRGKGAERAFSVRNYGMDVWGDLFNSRQKLTLITFVENVRKSYKKMLEEGYSEDYAKAIVSYLALMIDRQADYNSTLCRWVGAGEFIGNTFSRSALPMIWDYIELCPWSKATGDWNSALGWVSRVVEHLSKVDSEPATVAQLSATSLPYQDCFFDAVFTDPPYYDNVPYSYLSDFFYVWLKRTVGDIYPELFSTPLTPKSKEIVAYANIEGGWEAGKKFFEDTLKKSFQEINRVLKPNGISVIVYAHKSTAGWETLINSLLDSGLVVTAAWPIHTEMKARLRGKESAALASSIYMVCKKIPKESTGFYKEVKEDLRKHLDDKLDKLWNEGIAGADFFIAAIGASIEVFGKYEKIIDDEGNAIRADRFLEMTRTIVTDYAVHKILHNGFAADITQMSRFYILWRWSYGEAAIPFDDARKLAQSVGIDLTHEWGRRGSFIMKDKEFIKVLGPEDRKGENESTDPASSKELIDVLHNVLLLWKRGKKEEMVKILRETGYGKNDVFYRVAQAISETLPDTSREKRLLDGFLAGKGRLADEVRKDSGQKRLFVE